MTIDSMLEPIEPPRRRRRGLETVLIVGFLVCLVIGIAAFVGLWMLSQTPQTSLEGSSFQLFQPDQVSIGLAVRQLAGDPVSALAGQAIQAGELPTAAALLLYNTESIGSGRVGLWRQLAQRLGEQDGSASALAFKQVLSLSVLDLALRSLERSQLLTQATEGFLAAGDVAAAQSAATQALRVVVQSPDLLPAQRNQLLAQLKPSVAQLDDSQLLAQVDDFLRNPFVNPTGVLLANSTPIFVAPPPIDPAVEAAQAPRILAARNLAERYVLTNGIDVEPERQALSAALLAEDQVRSIAYRAQLAEPISLQQQLGLLRQQRNWVIQKLQVAQKAFGMSIVAEWEASQPALLAELDGLNNNIATVTNALADTQPSELEQNMLRAEVAHSLALQSAVGLYPGANNLDIGERLRLTQSEMARLGASPALPVAYEADAYPSGFRIQQR